jgi:hypothetical protein
MADTDASTQMDTITITTSLTANIKTQTMHCPGQKEMATQTEPLDDNHPHSLEGIQISTKPQVSPTIVIDPQPEPQVPRSALLHDELVKTPERQATPTPPPMLQPTPRFDWAEDAGSLPIASLSPPLPRDISVLCSNAP